MTLGPSVAALLQLLLLVSGDVGVWLVLMNPLLMYIIFVDFVEFEDRPATEEMDVIVSITNMRQWMSLECAINPGSFPKPIIEWVRHTAGDPEDVVMVVEEDEPNTIRFVDDGRFLILETTSEAITDKEYYYRVTNPEFTAGRAPTTYTFNIGQSLFTLNLLLGEYKAFVGERNERKRQGRLRLRVARGRMRTDRGRLMTYKHTNKIAIEFTSTGSLRSPN